MSKRTSVSSMTSSWTLKRVQTKNRQRLGYRRVVQLLVYLVIIPTVLLLSAGIGLMFVGERFNLVFGILIVSFVAVAGLGIVLVLVFVRREANLSELQADFVSKVSHELRTPLTAIRLFAETLERASDEATRGQCIHQLLTESDRLSSRIDRLLDWGRMEAGRKLYDLREEPVRPMVEDAAVQFLSLSSGVEVDFSSESEDDLPLVLADRHAIVDVLLNLLTNALKYGGTPPAVRLRAYKDEKGQAVLEVGDNGAGIPRGEHRRIFEKFYRIDDRLSRSREGSGLGLAIVKHIVRAHRGRIEVDSAPGRGSKFRIILPRWVPVATRADRRGAGEVESAS
jgi:two-component system phosphate regulon sensor histidine kinase PhoR